MNAAKSVTFERADLFLKVWEQPLLILAREVGVSDVALAKACRKADIPLPGRGHWAKLERARPKPPKLPPLKDPQRATITFTVFESALPANLVKAERVKASPVPVGIELAAPHPLVAKFLRAAKAAKTVDGRLVLPTGVITAKISPMVIERVCLLLDALVKACATTGLTWSVAEGKTLIACQGEQLTECREKEA